MLIKAPSSVFPIVYRKRDVLSRFDGSADDEAVPLRAHGHIADVTADGPLHILHVVPGVFRQLVPAADLGDVALPAVHVLDDGLGVLKADGKGNSSVCWPSSS